MTPIKDKFGNTIAGHYRGDNGCIQIKDTKLLEEHNKEKSLHNRISTLENNVQDIFVLLNEIKKIIQKES